MNQLTEAQLDRIADSLVEKGYVLTDNLLADELLGKLLAAFNQLRADEFKSAGIGRQLEYQLETTIRSDRIHWLSPTSEATRGFLQWMESLRVGLNQRLYLGLFDYESHFAHYPVGAFYKKHLDAFGRGKQGTPNRVLSTVLYLNKRWHLDDGGELVIYSQNDNCVVEKVIPTWGRLVIFLSEKFPHEVLPATRERNSVAGWFRVNEGVF
jgi:SM-20-related protein